MIALAKPATSALRFAVAGTPVPQGSKSPRILGKRIKVGGHWAVISPRVAMVESGDMKTKTQPAHRLSDWRSRIAAAARRVAPPELIDGPVELSVEFVLPRPATHYTKSGRLTKSAPLLPGSKPDLSKLTRAVEDALTGVVYTDDARVVRYGEGHGKRYAELVDGRPGVGGVFVQVVAL